MFLMSPYQRHYLPSSLLPVFYFANLSSVIHLALPLCNVYPTHIGLSSYCSLFWFVSFFFRFFWGGGGIGHQVFSPFYQSKELKYLGKKVQFQYYIRFSTL